MADVRDDLTAALTDPDPVRRAQIQMLKPLPKRFYTEVSVQAADQGFAIHLDGRSVKTPAKNLLVVPTHAAAELLQAEWAAQTDVIDPSSMPVTRLANTALDGIAQDPQAVIDDIVRFAGTDMICYRADQPQELVSLQDERWGPVLAWAAETYGARFILAQGVMHQTQPPEAIDAFRKAIARYQQPLALAALHTVTTLTGSALLSLALVEQRLNADEAWALAHVDEDWNVQLWGSDEEAELRRAHRWKDMQAAAKVLSALRVG